MVGAIVTPLSMLALGAVTSVRHPGDSSAATVVMIGAMLMLIAAFDYPLVSRCTDLGLHRRCMARRHVIPWSSVVAVELGHHTAVAVTTGGRRYLLAAGRPVSEPHLAVPAGVALRVDPRKRPRRRPPV